MIPLLLWNYHPLFCQPLPFYQKFWAPLYKGGGGFQLWWYKQLYWMPHTKSVYNKRSISNVTKIVSFFVFLYGSYFLLGLFYFKCNWKNPSWYSMKQANILYERFSLKITNTVKGLKYCKFTQKRNNVKHVMKKDHSKR